MLNLHLQITDNNERWGNKIAINMFAHSICRNFSSFKIFGSSIPELGILNNDYISTIHLKNLDLAVRDHSICPVFLSKQIKEKNLSTIALETNGVWYSHFKDLKAYFHNLMKDELMDHRIQVPDNQIVINLRTNEVLNKNHWHKDYGVLSKDYYLNKASETGLKPIFIGQITQSDYVDDLQKTFPESEFIDPGMKKAFATMFFAKNKVLCLSSFSWYASWLGVSSASIHMPVLGFYNPLQRPDMNWLPYDDPRYIFDYFPIDRLLVTDLTGMRKFKRNAAQLKAHMKKKFTF